MERATNSNMERSNQNLKLNFKKIKNYVKYMKHNFNNEPVSVWVDVGTARYLPNSLVSCKQRQWAMISIKILLSNFGFKLTWMAAKRLWVMVGVQRLMFSSVVRSNAYINIIVFIMSQCHNPWHVFLSSVIATCSCDMHRPSDWDALNDFE